MVMDTDQLVGMRIISYILLFIMTAIAISFMLLSIPRRRRRWRWWFPGASAHFEGRLAGALSKILLSSSFNNRLEERRQLLTSCGFRIDPTLYEAVRRLAALCLMAIGITGLLGVSRPALVNFMNPVYLIAGSCCLLVFLFCDRTILVQLKQRRSHRIVKEIYLLSNQLLYYSGSRMNLHAKLTRCLPLCKGIRPELQLLLNEWYQHGGEAIGKFKLRLGTEEAYSFAETLNSLRLNEADSYYELLRQRILDYKERIELTRESRKETVSYMLFVLAGLPILNTFRVFMYPWMIEGQQLFNSIN